MREIDAGKLPSISQYYSGPEMQIADPLRHSFGEYKIFSYDGHLKRDKTVHEFNRVHEYEKLHTYEKVGEFSHLNEHKYKEYRPNYITKDQHKALLSITNPKKVEHLPPITTNNIKATKDHKKENNSKDDTDFLKCYKVSSMKPIIFPTWKKEPGETIKSSLKNKPSVDTDTVTQTKLKSKKRRTVSFNLKQKNIKSVYSW